MAILTKIPSCPWCSRPLEAVTHVGKFRSLEKPIPGTVSLCNLCAKALVWKGDKLVRPLTGQDIAAMDYLERRALLIAMTAAKQALRESGHSGAP